MPPSIQQVLAAFVAEHHVVLRHDLLAAHVLDRRKLVADHLEDDVGVIERKTGHDETALSREADGVTVVVTGSASDEELAQVGLRRRPEDTPAVASKSPSLR